MSGYVAAVSDVSDHAGNTKYCWYWTFRYIDSGCYLIFQGNV